MEKKTIFIICIIMILVIIYFLQCLTESFDLDLNENKYRLILIKTKESYLIYLKYPDTKYNKIYKIYKNKLNNIIF